MKQRHRNRRPGRPLSRAATCRTRLSPPPPAPAASRGLRSRWTRRFTRQRTARDAALFLSLSELPTAVETLLFICVNQVHVTVTEAGGSSSPEMPFPTAAFLTNPTCSLKPAYNHRPKFRGLLFAEWLSAIPQRDGDEASSLDLAQEKVSPHRAVLEHTQQTEMRVEAGDHRAALLGVTVISER